MAFPDGISQTPFKLSSGSVDLPILYRDLTTFGATYTADAEAVRALLPSPDFRPLEKRGRALVSISVFEYRKTTIDPYNEFAVVIPILYKPILPGAALNLLMGRTPLGRMGGYIPHLPVTTQIALDAGKEVWGFPKIIASIAMRKTDSHFECDMRLDPGNPIVKLRVPCGGGPAIPFPDMTLYSVKDGKVLQTRLQTRGGFRRADAGGVSIELGSHPISKDLAGLKLSDKPVFALYSDNLRTRLPLYSRVFPLK